MANITSTRRVPTRRRRDFFHGHFQLVSEVRFPPQVEFRGVVHAFRRAVQSHGRVQNPGAERVGDASRELGARSVERGSIYFDLPLTVSGAGDRLSAISLIVLVQAFMAFDQLLLFPKERGLYLHESNGGMYGTGVYYWARIIVESVSIIAFAIVCAVISYEMFHLDDSLDGRITFYVIIIAVTMAGASFLTMIGSLCKSFEQTNALAGTLLIILMLFDGNWINRRNIPVYYRWLADVSFLGYAVEAAVSSDFKRHDFVCTARAVQEEGCVPLSGIQILRSLDFDPDSTWPKFWLLVAVSLCYRLVTFVGLHFFWTGQSFKERWAKLFESV